MIAPIDTCLVSDYKVETLSDTFYRDNRLKSVSSILDVYIVLNSPIAFSCKDACFRENNSINSPTEESLYIENNRPISIDSLTFALRMETQIIEMQKKATIDDTLYYIFKSIEDCLIKKNYDNCDRFVEYINVDNHNVNILIGVLTASLPWKNRLSYRSSFFNKVKNIVYGKYQIDEAEAILKGLE